MKHFATLVACLFAGALTAQELYFPPTVGNTWATTDPASLGWCTDQIPALYDFLEGSNSKAFIVLKDGRIVLERYFGTFTADSSWYWASAGKSLTAFMVGLAQQQGYLDIDEPSNTYLGEGWSSCTPEQEAAITIRDHLTMTTGLDDTNGEFDCTDPECLTYLTEPGSRWSYYNAPYTLLDGVLEGATGQNLNNYIFANLTSSTGITGLFVQLGYNNVFLSKARSMARFGLLAQNGGTWNGTPILTDEAYFTAMTTPSQSLNPAYGYLWWLNGQTSYLLPGVQIQLPGPLMPDAPSDIYAAMGKNGQIINVSPGTGLVVVRMGNLPDGLFVPNVYNNEIWQELNAVICTPTALVDVEDQQAITLHPNPVQDQLTLTLPATAGPADLYICDALGRTVLQQQLTGTTAQLDLQALPAGSYRCVLTTAEGRVVKGFVKE
ncbi:MAG: serine hydrolase [Flavobacteriales bacterium]|nr:serine hydrolase [Flavobacteriales bacterium]